MGPERPEARRTALDTIVRMRGRRRLLFGSVCVLLIRLVTADDASSDGADFAVNWFREKRHPAGPIRSSAVPASASADADNRTRMCNNFRAEESDGWGSLRS